jgi:uncharacterized C2H2 Zn-finger protein
VHFCVNTCSWWWFCATQLFACASCTEIHREHDDMHAHFCPSHLHHKRRVRIKEHNTSQIHRLSQALRTLSPLLQLPCHPVLPRHTRSPLECCWHGPVRLHERGRELPKRVRVLENAASCHIESHTGGPAITLLPVVFDATSKNLTHSLAFMTAHAVKGILQRTCTTKTKTTRGLDEHYMLQ